MVSINLLSWLINLSIAWLNFLSPLPVQDFTSIFNWLFTFCPFGISLQFFLWMFYLTPFFSYTREFKKMHFIRGTCHLAPSLLKLSKLLSFLLLIAALLACFSLPFCHLLFEILRLFDLFLFFSFQSHFTFFFLFDSETASYKEEILWLRSRKSYV